VDSELRKKEVMYIRHRIQKTLLDKTGKEPDIEVSLSPNPRAMLTW